jgi:hypothetical protein
MKDTAGSSGRDFAKLRVIFLTRNLYYIVYMGVLFSSSRMVFWRVGASFDCNQSLNKFEVSELRRSSRARDQNAVGLLAEAPPTDWTRLFGE